MAAKSVATGSGAALLLATLFAVGAWLLVPRSVVEVKSSETGERYFAARVEEGDLVRLSWTHSIEKTPWVEEYEISDGELHLRETRVKSFGAGVDQNAPKVENRDGWVVMSGYERSFETLRFFHSRNVERKLLVAGERVNLDAEVEQYEPVEVGARRVSRAGVWFGEKGG